MAEQKNGYAGKIKNTGAQELKALHRVQAGGKVAKATRGKDLRSK